MLARDATAFFQAAQVIHIFIAHKRAKLNRLINNKPRAATDAFVSDYAAAAALNPSTHPRISSPTDNIVSGKNASLSLSLS